MGRRGKFKYICDSCKAENWLTTKDRNSHFRPRCVECGSTWLEPSKKSEGPDKLANARDVAKDMIRIQKKKMGVKDD
jgi:transposase-like protein